MECSRFCGDEYGREARTACRLYVRLKAIISQFYQSEALDPSKNRLYLAKEADAITRR